MGITVTGRRGKGVDCSVLALSCLGAWCGGCDGVMRGCASVCGFDVVRRRALTGGAEVWWILVALW